MQAAPFPHAALGPLRARAARRSKRSSGTAVVPPARPRSAGYYSTLRRRDSANRRPAELNQLRDRRGIRTTGPDQGSSFRRRPEFRRDLRRTGGARASVALAELRRVDARSWWACLVTHAHPLRAAAPGAGGQVRGQDVALVPAGPARVRAGPRGATDMYRLSHDQIGGYPRWRRPHIRRRLWRGVRQRTRPGVAFRRRPGSGRRRHARQPTA